MSSLRVRIATAPEANASTMPGTKWWMCRRPSTTFWNGPTRSRSRSAHVTVRTLTNVATKDPSRLKVAFSRAETSW